MATISETLKRALKFHQQGDLAAAEQLYREVIDANARSADAWHLLGLIEHARGDFTAALEHIGLAIQLDGSQASFHNHLGEVYRSLGNLPQAEACCRRAVDLQSDYAVGHNTLGAVLAEQGKNAEAVDSYRQAIGLKPDFVEAQVNLALTLAALARLDEAIVWYRSAVRCKPDDAMIHHHLGSTLHADGDLSGAIAAFRRAVAVDPQLAVAHHGLGTLLHEQSCWEEAIGCYRKAVELQPDYAAAHCNLGSALKEQGRMAEAAECFARALKFNPTLAEAHFYLGVIEQNRGALAPAADQYQNAVRLRPDYAEAISNLGTVYKSLGQWSDALACYERALALREDLVEAHRNRALLRLLLGTFAEGWPEYEWRWRVKGSNYPTFAQPRWQGQSLAGRSVLLRAEQGLGDAIQFARYAALVKQRCQGQVLLECPASMHALLRNVSGIDRLLTGEPYDASFDCHVPLLSLPAIFGTLVETVPAQIPYLFAEPDRVERWRRQLSNVADLKVGIAWQGNPGYTGDAQRSVPLETFAPLAALPEVRLFSLQKGHGREQVAALAERVPLVDLATTLDEQGGAFLDTAAVMMSLDLVITSDTAIAHLAGALGVPVWVALPYVPDWRWLLEREDSPWYPTMRLFRQRRPDDWADVFARIRTALASLSPQPRAHA